MRPPHGTMSDFFHYYAPDFCWVTAWDLYLMYEQIDEDANWYSFHKELHRYTGLGLFERKPSSYLPYQLGHDRPWTGRTSMYLRKK